MAKGLSSTQAPIRASKAEKLNIEFFVPGIPATAGSKTGFPVKNKKTGKIRVIMAPASKKQKPWMSHVRNMANEAYNGNILTCPIELRIVFYLPRPKSHYGTGKNINKLKDNAPIYANKRPDLTKLVRSIEDSLIGVIWKDDSQVVMQHTGKFYADKPGAKIFIKTLETCGSRTENRGKMSRA